MQPPQADTRSDAELIGAVRSGERSAFGVLYSRHAPAATAMARYYARDNFTADDLVSEAFEKTYTTLRGGGGPDVSFRAYVYTTIRRQAYELTEKGRRTQVTDDFTPYEMPEEVADPAVDSFENRMVSTAFAGLPERWQAVLWYLEVEGMRPPEVAVLLGLTANGVSALAYRAREGLREAYLQAHISSDSRTVECQALRGKLGAFANGTLAARESAKVASHVAECAECSTILKELKDVGHGLRVIVAPLILGGAATAGLLGASRTAPATAAAFLAPAASSGVAQFLVLGAASVLAVAALAIAGSIALTPSLTSAGNADTAPESWNSVPLATPQLPTTGPTPASTTTPSPTRTPTTPIDRVPPAAKPAQPAAPAPAPAAPPPTPTPTPTPTDTPPPVGPPQLSVAMEEFGPLVLGRDGMVGARTTNTGTGPAEQLTTTFHLPPGTELDPGRPVTWSGIPWTCGPGDASSAVCAAEGLAAGASTTVQIPVTVGLTTLDFVVPSVVVSTPGVASAIAVGESTVYANGMGARYVADGSYVVASAGASFLRCDVSLAGCTDALSLQGSSAAWDNDSWNLMAVDAAGEGAVSSSTDLAIPPGAEVAFAGLYWSAPVPSGDSDATLGNINLRSPAGTLSTVSAEQIDRGVIDLTQTYQAYADVTTIVAADGGGSWTASAPRIGPGASANPLDFVGPHSAGWSLVVVYEDSTVAPGRVVVFDGYQVLAGPTALHVLTGVPGATATTDVVVWDGDAGVPGDGLSLDGVGLARSEAGALPGNSFSSLAAGSAVRNTFGVDVGSFLPVPMTSSRPLMAVSSGADHFALGVITLSMR